MIRKIKWTSEEQLREYTRNCIRKDFYSTAGSIASKSFYAGFETNKDFKYDKVYSICEDEIRRFKQRHNPVSKEKYCVDYREQGSYYTSTGFYNLVENNYKRLSGL